jgi:nitrate/TMAO reductase-like tetraheme cytochrome c subunit
MSATSPQPPPNRPTSRSSRARRRRAAAAKKPGIIYRLAHLQGKSRLVAIAGAVLVLVGIAAATGGTAYALNQENHDDFCASCHTQPESNYYQQATAVSPATLASFHATKDVRCIDCHSSGGPLGRLDGLMQGSRDLVSYYSGRYHNPAITTSPLPDDHCLKCHEDVQGQGGFNNHFHRFLSTWQARDPQAAGCVSCHQSHTAAGASVNDQFMNVPHVQAVCQSCHAVLAEGE